LPGSPDCSIDRTFTSTFYFPKKSKKIKHIYRNPIFLAREYESLIDKEHVKNQTDLARKLTIYRVRIHQILILLKLDSLIIQELEKFGDPLKTRTISERVLQPYTNKSIKEQKELLYILKSLFNIYRN